MPKKTAKSRAKTVRCGWCGRSYKVTRDGRIPRHKADHEWEYRKDDLCPGSRVLIKHLPPVAVSTQPPAPRVKPKKKTRKKVKKNV